ncbi:unnamed protein product [marine sediment metagenome]|uniref:Tripartite ATP-independent periplasmic transporters DctQ component domain-containing protein n=1 Tax=marine sediment metagenome TaxID=412755 RepID=X1UQD9_9ZZZZ
MMKKLEVALGLIDKLNDKVGKGVIFLIAALTLMVVFSVMMRYGLNLPTAWSFEAIGFVFGTYIILAGGYALLHSSHVTVDILYSRFSPRGKAALDVFTSVVFFLFAVVLVWQGWQYAWHSVELQQTTGSPWNPPVYPVKLMLPIGGALLLLQGIALI